MPVAATQGLSKSALFPRRFAGIGIDVRRRIAGHVWFFLAQLDLLAGQRRAVELVNRLLRGLVVNHVHNGILARCLSLAVILQNRHRYDLAGPLEQFPHLVIRHVVGQVGYMYLFPQQNLLILGLLQNVRLEISTR